MARTAPSSTHIVARQRRRLRLRRHGRRAYIRSAYSLPTLATLGNAICGFAAMYVCTLNYASPTTPLEQNRFVVAAYLIFMSMLFDALDGRLARLTRHTTDFGGQLDSLADVISFGAAPAFLMLQVFREDVIRGNEGFPLILSRLIWAIGALYVACAAIRLARFNVSNEHGEQHHFSFLGLPSPGAGAVVAALVLMQQDLKWQATSWSDHATLGDTFAALSAASLWAMPIVLLVTGLLMVSNVRYPHLVNRHLRGKRSLGHLILILILLLGLVVAHRYVICIGTLFYALSGLLGSTVARLRSRGSGKPPIAPST